MIKRFISYRKRIIQIIFLLILFLPLFFTHYTFSGGDKEEVEQLMAEGNEYLEKGEPTKAMVQFKKIIEMDPENPFAHNNLGLAYKEKGLFNSAKKSFETALEFMPNYYKALNNLGNLYYEMGEYEEAQGCYENALEIHPDFPEGHWNLALCYEKTDEYILALREWRKYIASDENSIYVPLARNHISDILEKMND